MWPLANLLIRQDEHQEARSLILGLADSRVEDFEVSKTEILEANHWLLENGKLSESEQLLRLEHLHSTAPEDNNLAERLWDGLIEGNLETRAVHLAIEMAEHQQGVIRATWLLGAAELELEVLKRLDRAAEICATLLSEHSDYKTSYSMVLDYDLELPTEIMITGYQNLRLHEFDSTFLSQWAGDDC